MLILAASRLKQINAEGKKTNMSGPQGRVSKQANKKPSHHKSINTNIKKRKASADEEVTTTTQTSASTTKTITPGGPSNKKQKNKKNPTRQDAILDVLLDLEHSVNTIFAKMDPDLLADYVAAQTKRFGGDDLSVVELSDLYVPAGAIRDTTTTTTSSLGEAKPRTKENLAEFLEENVGGTEEKEREKEKKRLGTAPKDCGAPHTIIVTGAGLRAADLVR